MLARCRRRREELAWYPLGSPNRIRVYVHASTDCSSAESSTHLEENWDARRIALSSEEVVAIAEQG